MLGGFGQWRWAMGGCDIGGWTQFGVWLASCGALYLEALRQVLVPCSNEGHCVHCERVSFIEDAHRIGGWIHHWVQKCGRRVLKFRKAKAICASPSPMRLFLIFLVDSLLLFFQHPCIQVLYLVLENASPGHEI